MICIEFIFLIGDKSIGQDIRVKSELYIIVSATSLQKGTTDKVFEVLVVARGGKNTAWSTELWNMDLIPFVDDNEADIVINAHATNGMFMIRKFRKMFFLCLSSSLSLLTNSQTFIARQRRKLNEGILVCLITC